MNIVLHVLGNLTERMKRSDQSALVIVCVTFCVAAEPPVQFLVVMFSVNQTIEAERGIGKSVSSWRLEANASMHRQIRMIYSTGDNYDGKRHGQGCSRLGDSYSDEFCLKGVACFA